jgi:hypothetical protein
MRVGGDERRINLIYQEFFIELPRITSMILYLMYRGELHLPEIDPLAIFWPTCRARRDDECRRPRRCASRTLSVGERGERASELKNWLTRRPAGDT